MEGGEDAPAPDRVDDAGGRDERATAGDDANAVPVAHVVAASVVGVDLEEGLGFAAVELGHFACAGAGVPPSPTHELCMLRMPRGSRLLLGPIQMPLSCRPPSTQYGSLMSTPIA